MSAGAFNLHCIDSKALNQTFLYTDIEEANWAVSCIDPEPKGKENYQHVSRCDCSRPI
jgi:hypothetical protein